MPRNANTKDEQIEALQGEITQLRHVVLAMLPVRLHALLQESPRYVRTLSQQYRWRDAMVKQLIEMIETPAPEQDYVVRRDRINCPLCGQRPDLYSTTGFTFPEGLTRHLLGKGSARSCRVLEVAHALAKDIWAHHKLIDDSSETFEDMQRRRATETLYQVSPYPLGELFDYRFWVGILRSQESLKVAEAQLQSLGFLIQCNGNTVAYTCELQSADGYSIRIYADPRRLDGIDFRCFVGPASRVGHPAHNGSFSIPDKSHYELRDAFRKGLAEATKVPLEQFDL